MPRERRRTPRHQLGRVAAILCGPGEERSCLVKDFSDGGVRLQLNGVIQMSLIDTWAATGAGAFTLTENGLYTVEAWRRFLGRLNADGLFTVSLAVATLLTNGAAEPRRHLFLAAAGKVATLIVAKSPLSPSALAALKDAAKANEFTVLLSPDTAAPSAMLEKIVSATDRRSLDQATAGFYLDLTPPTDARPFFFNQLGFAKIFDPRVFSHFTHTGVRRQPHCDADPRHARCYLNRTGRRDDHCSLAADGQRSRLATGGGRHRLFRPDRGR